MISKINYTGIKRQSFRSFRQSLKKIDIQVKNKHVYKNKFVLKHSIFKFKNR
jgi:hypothetical protein